MSASMKRIRKNPVDDASPPRDEPPLWRTITLLLALAVLVTLVSTSASVFLSPAQPTTFRHADVKAGDDNPYFQLAQSFGIISTDATHGTVNEYISTGLGVSFKEIAVGGSAPNQRRKNFGGLIEFQAGWPIRWVSCSGFERQSPLHAPTGNERVWDDSLFLTNRRYQGYGHRRPFPGHVHWLPLCCNVLIFFAAALALLFAVRLTRGYSRLCRHRCPKCNYPFGPGLLCAECGFRLRAAADPSN